MSLDISIFDEPVHHLSWDDDYPIELFWANITHNLNSMADEAGIYKFLWRAPENKITKAKQLIKPLTKGIELMEADPPRFIKFNPSNGWGSYDVFVPWLKRLLKACVENPEGYIYTSR